LAKFTLPDVERLIREGKQIDPRDFGLEVRPARIVAEETVEKSRFRRIPIERFRFSRSDMSARRMRRLAQVLERAITFDFPKPVTAVFDPNTGALILAGDGNHRVMLALARGARFIDAVVEHPASAPLGAVFRGEPVPTDPRSLISLVSRQGRSRGALTAARRATRGISRQQRLAVEEVANIRRRVIREMRGAVAEGRKATRFQQFTIRSTATAMDEAIEGWANDLTRSIERSQRRAVRDAIQLTLDQAQLDPEILAAVQTRLGPGITENVIDGLLGIRTDLVDGLRGEAQRPERGTRSLGPNVSRGRKRSGRTPSPRTKPSKRSRSSTRNSGSTGFRSWITESGGVTRRWPRPTESRSASRSLWKSSA
jgi:hypothetical protein